MRQWILLWLLTVISIKSDGQLAGLIRVPAYIGWEAYGNSQKNIFCILSNAASLADWNITGIGVLADRKYALNDLSSFHALGTVHLNAINLALGVSHGGSALFNETGFAIAGARGLGNRMGVGWRFNYYLNNRQGYGSKVSWGMELATLLRFSDKIRMCIKAANPVRGNLAMNKEEKIPLVYSIGSGYAVSDLFFLAAELIKEEDQAPYTVIGFLYQIHREIGLRAGISTGINSPWFAAEFALKRYLFMLGASYHIPLGWTPTCSFQFIFRKAASKKERERTNE